MREQDVLLLPHQHETVGAQERTIVTIGGVGSGKSLGCIYGFIAEIQRFPYCQPYAIGPTYGNMKEGQLFSLKAMLDELDIEYEQNRSDLSITIDTDRPGGTRVIPWTAEAFRRLKGQAMDIVWGDEAQVWERGHEVFDFIGTRMRPSETARVHHPDHVPRMWLSANPPHSTGHWLYQYFVKKNPPNTRLIRTTTFDNYLLPLREQYIERMRSTMDPQLFAIEVMGEWGDIGVGRVYTQFDDKKNVGTALTLPGGRKIELDYDKAKPHRWTHDFGVSPRVAISFQVIVPPQKIPGYQREIVFVFDEYSMQNGSTFELIGEFTRRNPPESISSLILHGDPAGQTRNSTTGLSDWAMLRDDPRMQAYRGLIERGSAAPLIVDRTNAMNAKLCNAAGDVGIIIHPRCTKLREDLQQTAWKDGTRQLDHGTPAKGLHRTHWSDALGYPVELTWPLTTRHVGVIGHGWSQR